MPAILAVSILSGTMGIGVAFAAIPVLSLHGGDLVHAIQPVALCLNGVTAFFAAVSFGRAGYVNARRSVPLAATMTVFSPLGAFAAQWVNPDLLWVLYFVAVALVIYLLCAPRPAAATPVGARAVLAWSAPIAVFSSMLGVGPGFLVVPLLILAGSSPRAAAGTSAFAVVPASFAALVPHLASATPDIAFAIPVVGVSAVGAWVGGYFASRSIPEHVLRNLFVSLILALASYKACGMAWARLSPQPAATACEQPAMAGGGRANGCTGPG
ncbi:MAG: sulfite exporter TauE/SafE family protein [Proteobacteria bacterium]|nr:sulfite exporter TauE/SafE family protein [Pseudomonadota bacterium]